MKTYAENSKTGKGFSGEAAKLNEKTIGSFFDKFNVSEEEIDRWIRGLAISADAKMIMSDIAKTTIRAGDFVIRIGRKILDVIEWLLREFPKATLGLILGAVIGTLVISIPVIGVVIGPLFKTIVMVLGITIGSVEDIKDKNMARRIQEAMMQLETLKAR